MREVTREEFYAHIGKLDVHPVPTGSYPYTSVFKYPSDRVAGQIVDSYPEGGVYPLVSRYYLNS